MHDILLATKLRIPPVRTKSVYRQRLTDHLNASLTYAFTLVAAPAGFGKTTLVSQWANQMDAPVAWLSLDEADNDPTRFLAYVTASLGSAAPYLDQSILPLLQSPQPSPMDAILTVLINRLTNITTPFILVLDDYHLIRAAPIHNAISFLLEHLPPAMHLMLITRADPPFPLARLRARGQMAELRAADLVFTPEESTTLLTQVMALALSADDIRALVERTEGWAAGLQLAALSMQGRNRLSDFVASFTGSHEYIVEYLVNEVLNQQPERIRRFLLETSILAQLNGPLCSAVTGIEDGAELLSDLERQNLFVFPLDDVHHWHRYHRLFADVLQQRLQQTSPQHIDELHRRAGAWLAENNHTLEALPHALAACDYELAAPLVGQAAEQLMRNSETTTLLHWIEQLPDETVRKDASLCAFHAWCLLVNGQPVEAVEERLHAAEKIDPALSLPTRAFIACYQGKLAEAQHMAAQAIDELSEEHVFMRTLARWVADIAVVLNMRLSDVDERLFQMTADNRLGPVMTIVNLCHLAEIRMRQGHLHDARSLYDRAISLAVDSQGDPLPIEGMALIGLGSLAYEWNDLEKAAEAFTEGIKTVAQWSAIGSLDGYMGLFMVYRAQGDFDAAHECIRQAAELAMRFDAAEADDMIVDLVEARMWITEGNLDRAARWVEEHGLEQDPSRTTDDLRIQSAIDYHLRHHQIMTMIRLWIAQGRFEESAALIETLLAAMEERGWLDSRREIECQALRALCLHAERRDDEAFPALERALTLAEPGGYVRTFVDEGPSMASLLHEAAGRGMHTAYVQRILSAFVSVLPHQPPEEQAGDLIEPLSDRELEVLHLMAEGLTNREIAERLYLAPTTVKVHARNIYSKLSVNNRMQAVASANSLGLLP